MSNVSFESRMISTRRNIRQRCQLKYSKFGLFTWDKWTEYDCIFSSFIDAEGRHQNQLELHSHENLHEPNGKIVDLKQLHSLTSVHGNVEKNDPRDIIILKIAGKKHRLGFDNVYEYNKWKALLDGVYSSSGDLMENSRSDENTAVNMHYESVHAQRYRVQFADLATQEILALPAGPCELIFDSDKLVLEQRHDKQYTFPRSTIRTIRLTDENTIEFELGSRAPVQGFIRFRFESPTEARSCYLHWNEGMTSTETSYQERAFVRQVSQRAEYPASLSNLPLSQQYGGQPLRLPPPPPPPKKFSTKSPYYNVAEPIQSVGTNVPQNEYTPFQTLV